MTLIDIDPLKERIDKEVKEGKVLDGWAFFIKAYLDSEPHIDIVRCKGCRHSEYREDYDDYLCDEDGISVHEANWYCADGEREGE